MPPPSSTLLRQSSSVAGPFASDRVRVTQCLSVAAPPDAVAALPPSTRLGPLDSFVPLFIPVVLLLAYPADAPSPSGGGDSAGNNTSEGAAEQTTSVLSVEKIHEAMKALLQWYPHLGGRVREASAGHGTDSKDSDEARSPRCVHSYTAGARLLLAECADRLPPAPTLFCLPGAGTPLACGAAVTNEDGTPLEPTAQPLLCVQLTHFACGGAVVGLRLLHSVADGRAATQILDDLRVLYADPRAPKPPGRAAGPLLPPPGLPPPPHCPNPSYQRQEPAAAAAQDGSGGAPAPEVLGRVLYLSEADVAAVAAAARAGLRAPGAWLSTYDALAGWLLQRVYAARRRVHSKKHDDNSPAPSPPPPTFLAPVDVRGPLGADGALFNGVQVTTAAAAAADLLALRDPAPAALAVHAAVRGRWCRERGAVEGVLAWLDALPGAAHLAVAHTPSCLQLSSFAKFDLYGAGAWGGRRPALAATTFSPISLLDGLGYVFPSARAGGRDLAVYLALAADVWEAMGADADGLTRRVLGRSAPHL